MNINNDTEFDSVTMKKFAKLWSAPTKGMKAFRISCVIFFSAMALLMAVCMVIVPELWVHGLIFYLYILLWVGMNLLKRKRIAEGYKSRGITAIRYTFCDEVFYAEVVSDKMTANDKISYSMMKKVIETDTFLCIWCKNGAYIVKIDGFSQYSDLSDLRIKLSSLLGKNYIFRK